MDGKTDSVTSVSNGALGDGNNCGLALTAAKWSTGVDHQTNYIPIITVGKVLAQRKQCARAEKPEAVNMVSFAENSELSKSSETRMTASVLKQVPNNHKRFKKRQTKKQPRCLLGQFPVVF